MPKPKDGPALFELMRATVPEAEAKGPDARQDEVPAAPKAPPKAVDRKPPAAPEPVAEPSPPETPPVDSRPVFEVVGGQVRLALTSQWVAVAIFCLGLLLLAAYRIGLGVGLDEGKRVGHQAAQARVRDDIQAARAKPPTEGLFQGVGPSPVVRPTAPAPAESDERPAVEDGPSWVTGYTYVAVQDFRADAGADVQRARQYLAENGVETVVVEMDGDWKYRLITVEGFNRSDPVQRKLADEFLTSVRALGQEYFKQGGRYRLEGYFITLTGETW